MPTWIWSPGASSASVTALPVDENVAAVAQALEPPGRSLEVRDEGGVLARDRLLVHEDGAARGIAAEPRLAEQVEGASEGGPGHPAQPPTAGGGGRGHGGTW